MSGATCLILGGCLTRPVDVQVHCLPMKDYSAAEQEALAAALAPLPADSVIVQFVIDYGAMRAANRACIANH